MEFRETEEVLNMGSNSCSQVHLLYANTHTLPSQKQNFQAYQHEF